MLDPFILVNPAVYAYRWIEKEFYLFLSLRWRSMLPSLKLRLHELMSIFWNQRPPDSK